MRIPAKSRWWWLIAGAALASVFACIPIGGHPFARMSLEELQRTLQSDLPIGTAAGAVQSYLRDHHLEPAEEPGVGMFAVARGAGSLINPMVRSYKISLEFSDEKLTKVELEEWLTGP